MKVLCPRHKEKTPSVEIYEENAFCFGCYQIIPLAELGVERSPKEHYVENIQAKIEYICTLPKTSIRGLLLPTDSAGYYIVWPDHSYFKLRVLEPADGQSKYKNPAGHRQPVLWVRKQGFRKLYIVEGELNAISLSYAIKDADICSPGSAGNFAKKDTVTNLTEYCKYANIVIVVDRDAAGTQAVIRLKGALIDRVPFVSHHLMEEDCNAILCKSGPEELKREVERALPQWMHGQSNNQ